MHCSLSVSLLMLAGLACGPKNGSAKNVDIVSLETDESNRPTWISVGPFEFEPTDEMRNAPQTPSESSYLYHSERFVLGFQTLSEIPDVPNRLASFKACREFGVELVPRVAQIPQDELAPVTFGRFQPPRAEWATAGCDLIGVAKKPTASDPSATQPLTDPNAVDKAISLSIISFGKKSVAALCLTRLRETRAMVLCRRIARSLRPKPSARP